MDTDAEILEKTEMKIAKPKKWAVVLHNDDVTPIQFVVALLMAVFHYSTEKSMELTTKIHEEGYAYAGVYTHEIAEMKHLEAMKMTEENNMSLKITLEELDD